ncbi:glycosyl transferase [Psychrobacter sp. L7]|uniref:glycosyltransferase n=1 Tax=Psychrobacter sp. L7 TaxID=1982756 RepID=UPI000C2B5304|nr:glycosyltransferase [Psychrobacter sp. L7]PJX24320.1 glycosyl transferase [Psychrobacter sp. L7]
MSNEIVKVFVGCDPNNSDLEQMMVLDYSIKKHTSMAVEIVWMQLSSDPDSFWYSNPEKGEGWDTQKWATPFSGFRWAIPEYCDFKGRAIYMDADMVVLSDLNDLWSHPIEGQCVVAAKTKDAITRLCTCVWDCQKAQNVLMPVSQLKADPEGHDKLMKQFKERPELITPYIDSYNCIDGEDLEIKDIKILHYSDMGTQFSHKYSIPRLEKEGAKHWFDGKIMPHTRQELSDLFDAYYQEAIDAGYSLENYRVEPFGVIPKKSHKRYKGNKITRPLKSGLLSKIFKR